MATQAAVNNLFKTLGSRIAEAHNAAKDVPVNVGGGIGLPGGIRGVAQLKVMEFIEGKKEDDKGKYYFRAAGVVQTPQFHEGIKCAGKQTSILIPFFDTPGRDNIKSFSVPNKDGKSHWNNYRDLFEKLGVSQPPAQQPGETVEAASARIQQYYAAATEILLRPTHPVYFEFHTWKGEKQTTGKYAGKEPNVSEFWDGRTEYTPQGAAVNPTIAVGAAPTGTTFTEPPKPATQTSGGAAQPPTTGDQPQYQPDNQPEDNSNVDVDALAEIADSDPDQETDEAKAAVIALSTLCKKLGITNEDTTACSDWTSVSVLIKARQAGTQTVAPTSNAPVVPIKGAMVNYNGQQCEVSSVNNDARTVTLKGPDKKAVLDAAKKLLKVSFDQLS